MSDDASASETETNRRVVAELWQCLCAKDWEGLAARIHPDGYYEDVPAPDAGATGPDNVVKRLRIGLDSVVRHEHEIHRTIAEGRTVIIEHTETWHFETGEKVVNPFVTIHEVTDGLVSLWRDYWDIGSLMAQAPTWWVERLASFSDADFS